MYRSFWVLAASLIIAFTGTASCRSQNKEDQPAITDTIPLKQAADISIPGSFSAPTKLVFDSSDIHRFTDSFPSFSAVKNDLYDFYRGRNYSFAWFDQHGMIEPADNLYNRIMNIKDEGLPDKILYKQRFTELMEREADNPVPSSMLDIMLSAQYLGYAKLAWTGLSKQKMAAVNWYLPRKETPYKQLLDSLLTGKNILDNEPVFRQYGKLKDYLLRYNNIQENGGWGMIKADKKNYNPGDTSPVIGQIRKTLFITGDLAEDNESTVYDPALLGAVKKYQQRFGYKENGIITATLIREMNVPVEKRIEQIVVNMERCRWVPVDLKSEFLLVNIPDYKVHLYSNDSVLWSMNVVVGKNQHKTVVFNGELKYIVFSPYWNIPASILKNETLPAMRRNPNYLARHNMEWNGGNVRQKPGPNNSLGLVKFLFPNSHSIYMHDTPAKSLFNEDKRAFSHGCIRLADAKKLVMYLLRNEPEWTEAKITAAMNQGKERTVTLKKPVPVFIAYFTSWVDRNGQLQFRNDVYQRDGRLAQMIMEKPAI